MRSWGNEVKFFIEREGEGEGEVEVEVEDLRRGWWEMIKGRMGKRDNLIYEYINV